MGEGERVEGVSVRVAFHNAHATYRTDCSQPAASGPSQYTVRFGLGSISGRGNPRTPFRLRLS